MPNWVPSKGMCRPLENQRNTPFPSGKHCIIVQPYQTLPNIISHRAGGHWLFLIPVLSLRRLQKIKCSSVNCPSLPFHLASPDCDNLIHEPLLKKGKGLAKGRSEWKAHCLEIIDKQKKMSKNQKPQKDRPCLVYAFCPFQKNISKLGLPSLKPNPINTFTENSEQ